MTTELIQGLLKSYNVALTGAHAGLAAIAPTLTREMRDSPAHGDVTGATHASYSARAVGVNSDGSAELAQARAAATALNPGEVEAVQVVNIDGIAGLLFDSPMSNSIYLETERAGANQVIAPMVSQGARYTAAAAQGIKKALT